jgi:addiction module HigA family antidote
MIPLGVTVSELASRLGVSRNSLSSIINGRAGVSPDMALRLSRALGNEPETWLKLQCLRDLWRAERFDSGWRDVERVVKESIIPPKRPGRKPRSERDRGPA